MFQYAVGRSLAISRGVPLFLDARSVGREVERPYALSGLRIDAGIAAPTELPARLELVARVLRRLPRWLAPRTYVVERSFSYDQTVLEAEPPALLYGNWQSERYFATHRDIIRADFQLAGPLTADRQAVADEICNMNSVSVHVRRGDYVSNPAAYAYHGTCEPSWYARAKFEIEKVVVDPHYFVFGDEVAWAKSNLPEFVSATFVERSEDGCDCQDLHLMALCRHHIIANSSFSWWGAWLNPRPDKRVIAPKRWFKGAANDTKDLIPAAWQRL